MARFRRDFEGMARVTPSLRSDGLPGVGIHAERNRRAAIARSRASSSRRRAAASGFQDQAGPRKSSPGERPR